MKRSVSHVAMALALTFGVAGTVGVAAPAYAQKQPKMEISEAFQPHAVAIQESVNDVAEKPAVKISMRPADNWPVKLKTRAAVTGDSLNQDLVWNENA